jgi:hypothetical protein
MTFRTRLYARLQTRSRASLNETFRHLPPAQAPSRVPLASTHDVWDLPGLAMQVPADLPRDVVSRSERLKTGVLSLLLRHLPNTERRTRWDRATAEQHLLDVLDGGIPIDLWADWKTDAGWARLFTQGPLASQIRREGDALVADVRPLSKAERYAGLAAVGVRVGLAIDERGPRPLWIELEDGTRVTPTDGAAWERARLIASAGLQTYTVFVKHLVHLHFCAAQPLAVLVHNLLPWEHPLARLLFPHTAGSLLVNWRANRSLLGPHGAVQAAYSYTWSGVKDLFHHALTTFDYADYDIPDALARKGLMPLIESGAFPYGEDALLVWGVIERYVRDYIEAVYPDEASFSADTTLRRALDDLQGVLPKPIVVTDRASLEHMLTRFIAMVTFEHKLVGGIAYEFMTVPYFFPHRAWDGATAEDTVPWREETEANLIGKWGTTARSYPLAADWSYVAVDERTRAAMRRFREALDEAGRTIDARNARRAHPFPFFHPALLESSIAV